MYAPMIHGKPVVATCHDMIACAPRARTAGAAVFALGKFLQRWICFGLRSANARLLCFPRDIAMRAGF